jgi:hypothetical protein
MVNDSVPRAARGSGSIRQRSPGVWEIRVVVGFDPIRARSLQRSFTVRGDAEQAEHSRQELVEDFGVSRVLFSGAAAGLTVADLLNEWLTAPHLWKRATVVSHASVARLARRSARPAPPGPARPERRHRRHPPMADRRLVSRDGTGAVAGTPLGHLLGRRRRDLALKSTGRDAGPTQTPTPATSHHRRSPPAPHPRLVQRRTGQHRP